MYSLGPAYTKQKLCLDYASLKHACLPGVYVAPLPDEPLAWAGVLFVRKGPYANAILRFHIAFPDSYPALPPVVTLLNDVFHPLVTPLTTYSYGTRDTGAETASAADDDRLPPGGLSLRQGFPGWFGGGSEGADNKGSDSTQCEQQKLHAADRSGHVRHPPHTIEVLQYLRIVFGVEALLDAVPLEAAANTGAWHAWRSYRSKVTGRKISRSPPGPGTDTSERSMSQRQQPGGARKPGEWNWQGVWEDRVRKSVQASISESALYGGDGNDVLCFSKVDADGVGDVMETLRNQTSA